MSPVLHYVIVPHGDLSLVMTSAEAIERRQLALETDPFEQQLEDPSSKEFEQQDSSVSGDVRIQVDATHLMRVSSVFRAYLDPLTLEGQQYRQSGQAELVIEDEDPEAMSHVMNALFHRSSQIPSTQSGIPMSIDLLSEVCVIVDKYDLREATFFVTEHWWHMLFPPGLDAGQTIKAMVYPDQGLLYPRFFKLVSITHVLKKEMLTNLLLAHYIDWGSGLDQLELVPLPDALYAAERRRVHALGTLNAFLKRLSRISRGTEADGHETYCTSSDRGHALNCDRKMYEALYDSFRRHKVVPDHEELDSEQSFPRFYEVGYSATGAAQRRKGSPSIKIDGTAFERVYHACQWSKIPTKCYAEKRNVWVSINTRSDSDTGRKYWIPTAEKMKSSRNHTSYFLWLAPQDVVADSPAIKGYELIGPDPDGKLHWIQAGHGAGEVPSQGQDTVDISGNVSILPLSPREAQFAPTIMGNPPQAYPSLLAPPAPPTVCEGPRNIFNGFIEKIKQKLLTPSLDEVVTID